jgi:GNAT superfamily N-acetyltransferase
MNTHPEFFPWLAGLFVIPSHRGRGIGSALARHATTKAFEAGVDSLYLYTSTATSLYERLGWQGLFRERYEGEWQNVMRYSIQPSLTRAIKG